MLVTEQEFDRWQDTAEEINSKARLLIRRFDDDELVDVLWDIVEAASYLKVDMYWCREGQKYLNEDDSETEVEDNE